MNLALKPNVLTPQDLEPNWRWENRLPAWGQHLGSISSAGSTMNRLRRYRLARTRQALEASQAGTLLLFDVNNIRYVSATKIGEWERDKDVPVLPADGGRPRLTSGTSGRRRCITRNIPTGSSPTNCLAGVVGMRGTIPPEFGLMQKYARQIAGLIRDAAWRTMPVGVDYAETAMFHALKEEGLRHRRRPADHARGARDQETGTRSSF